MSDNNPLKPHSDEELWVRRHEAEQRASQGGAENGGADPANQQGAPHAAESPAGKNPAPPAADPLATAGTRDGVPGRWVLAAIVAVVVVIVVLSLI